MSEGVHKDSDFQKSEVFSESCPEGHTGEVKKLIRNLPYTGIRMYGIKIL